ncbi:MAG: hypothetical protein ACT4QE_26805 [Anaerolineales bacterium]
MTARDAIAEQVLMETLVKHGRSRHWVGARLGNNRATTVRRASRPKHAGKSPAWTPEEDEYLRENLGRKSEAEIAATIGRTETAVHLRWKRNLRLPAPSRNPDILTAEQIAEGLGVNPKLIDRLIDEGHLSGWRLPTRRTIRVARRVTVLRWMANPEHWIFFRPERVNHGPRRTKRCYDHVFWARAQRLVQLACQRWNDEWLTAGQAAKSRGTTVGAINKAVRTGRLCGVKWKNWRFLCSEITRSDLVFFKGKGAARSVQYTEAGDVFLILARAVGLPWSAIGRMMHWPDSRCEYRFATLARIGAVARLIRAHGLKVHYQPRRRALIADWKHYCHRFPQLARVMCLFRSGAELMDPRDLSTVRGVLRAWAAWFARRPAEHDLARRLATGSTSTPNTLRATWRQLRRRGADPFRRLATP